MSTKTHHYSDTEANEVHNKIVNQIVSKFTEHEIEYPDEIHEDNQKKPDILIDDDLVIEVKVLNPIIEDFEIDIKAQKEFERNGSTAYGGTMNPKPIQGDIESAIKKFANYTKHYRLLVLYSPLIWQLKAFRLKEMLTGLTTLTIKSTPKDAELVRVRKTSVPLKQGVSEKMDAILFINGAGWENETIWTLNMKPVILLDDFNVEPKYFWSEE